MPDIVLAGGLIVDGTGSAPFPGDVAVSGDSIVAVGPWGSLEGDTRLDCEGLHVSPGFVDMHSHSDLALLSSDGADPKLYQGVTTEVIGQDGLSYAPATSSSIVNLRAKLEGWNGSGDDLDWSWRSVSEFLERFEGRSGTNVAYLAPHGTIRMAVMGDDPSAASSAQISEMKRLLGRAMDDGAVGLSAGLTYTPGLYASQSELEELCGVVAEYGGYYAPHHRNYGSAALAGYEECFEIARNAGVALHLTHANLSFPTNAGRANELLARVDLAVEEGIDVTLDSYPYAVSATYLHALLPPWAQTGGARGLQELAGSEDWEKLRLDVEVKGHAGYHGIPVDWSRLVVSGVGAADNLDWLIGLDLQSASAQAQRAPFNLFIEVLIQSDFGASCLNYIGNQENVDLIMRHPRHSGGTDGILVGSRPHPRGWGTFPRYIREYVNNRAVFSVEEIVRKFSAQAHRRLGFSDRGILRPGLVGDLVAFKLEDVEDCATFEEPRRFAAGFVHVLVNGQISIQDGQRTEVRSGRVLKRKRMFA